MKSARFIWQQQENNQSTFCQEVIFLHKYINELKIQSHKSFGILELDRESSLHAPIIQLISLLVSVRLVFSVVFCKKIIIHF